MGVTRTKIICTIGPATKDLAVLRKLYKAGMNVVRINMSHADHVFAKNIIDKVKKINSDKNSNNGPLGVLLDTQGPEIRTGDTELPIDLNTVTE